MRSSFFSLNMNVRAAEMMCWINRILFVILVLSLVAFTLNKSYAMQDSINEKPNMNKVVNDSVNQEQNKTHNKAGDEAKAVGYLNWDTKTLGGQQFWTDLRHAGGWRIQVNSETGHYRLLDPKSVRREWGNLLHCQQILEKKVVEGTAVQAGGKVVILLHGLIRTKSSMQPMADFLEQNGNYTTINFQYASTRNQIGEHAAALKSVIDHLGPNVTEICFVCHSLGNIVVRRYLGDDTHVATGRQGDARIKRMVMIGPPNQGSRMARVLKSSFLFQQIAGVSGVELSRAWDKLEPTLATPAFEFGIIAGGQETEKNFSNFILKGKDDFTVSLDEAKLIGAHDMLVRPLFHSTMMHQPEVMKATRVFFEHGYFESEQSRSPITTPEGGSKTPAAKNPTDQRSGR